MSLTTKTVLSQMQEAMLEYRANTYKKLFDMHPNPIALIRLSDGHLVEANYRFEKLFGCSKEGFRALGIKCFLNEDFKRMKKIARAALRDQRWFETECKLQLPNMDSIRVTITASLIRHDEQTLVQASIRTLP
jgi:PAS domain S-box-containing protein